MSASATRASGLRCDEIWSLVGAKDKDVPADKQGQFGVGSVWTWTAIDADPKFVRGVARPSRGGGVAYEFMQDVASRLRGRVHLTRDGHKPYLEASKPRSEWRSTTRR
jgi:hypothetical protein